MASAWQPRRFSMACMGGQACCGRRWAAATACAGVHLAFTGTPRREGAQEPRVLTREDPCMPCTDKFSTFCRLHLYGGSFFSGH